MTMDSSEGRLHFTGGKLSLIWLHWGQLPQWSSGCGSSVRVPIAASSHLIRVQVVRAILQTSSILSQYLEGHSLLPRTSQPRVGLTLTRPAAVRSTLDRGLWLRAGETAAGARVPASCYVSTGLASGQVFVPVEFPVDWALSKD